MGTLVKFRLEVARSPSTSWPLFVRAALRHPSCVHQKEKPELILLEFDSLTEMEPYLKMCGRWRSVVIYRGEELVSGADVWEMYMNAMGLDRDGRPLKKDFVAAEIVRDELEGPNGSQH